MPLTTPRAIICDIDGVLHVSMHPIAGAAETLTQLATSGYRLCFATNTTILSQVMLAQRLQDMGFSIPTQTLLTAPVATAHYIRQHFPGKRCWVLTKGETTSDFAGIELVDLTSEEADVVVIGGAEELLSYEAMNRAFRMLMRGAAFLTMHRNLYWKTSTGLQIDSGAYVHALEIATGRQATVLGKPDQAFFEQALLTLGVAAHETIMVGDDVVNDIAGAQHAGMRAILVCTGKYQAHAALPPHIVPDAILPSLRELPAYLAQLS